MTLEGYCRDRAAKAESIYVAKIEALTSGKPGAQDFEEIMDDLREIRDSTVDFMAVSPEIQRNCSDFSAIFIEFVTKLEEIESKVLAVNEKLAAE